MNKKVIAVDIGATSIKGGIVDSTGAVIARASTRTEGTAGPARVLDNAAKVVSELRESCKNPAALGISSCGTINPVSGTVIEATSVMPDWPGTNIAAEMEKRTGLACSVRNDGDCAALGEYHFGSGKDHRVFVMLTLGTGVGGGVVIDGKILEGEHFMAGRIGHMKAVPHGKVCSCGGKGCLEAYASAYACRRDFGGKDPAEIFLSAEEGNQKAAKFVEEAGTALGAVMADIAHCLNPGVIAVGGGISLGWHIIEPYVVKSFAETALPGVVCRTKVIKALCGNDAGLLGAAYLGLNLSRPRKAK